MPGRASPAPQVGVTGLPCRAQDVGLGWAAGLPPDLERIKAKGQTEKGRRGPLRDGELNGSRRRGPRGREAGSIKEIKGGEPPLSRGTSADPSTRRIDAVDGKRPRCRID